jgi:putative lipoic acid-binding regulatory protein
VANHRFPGPYLIKAFGAADDSFRTEIRAAVVAVVETRVQFSERTSRGGAKLCITAEIHANDVDEVLAIYESLYDVDGLRLVL